MRPIGRERVTAHNSAIGIAGRADSCNEVATLMIKDREGPGDFMLGKCASVLYGDRGGERVTAFRRRRREQNSDLGFGGAQ